ncbi:TPR domain protein [Aspergillus arachidicola]|uniref:TPR domain protein n=1 Tax=Aspergillus arachidicola TaxID=656916 RepID=A0A2G7FRT0_9EURO|nr:TPR domain protein [Aspergillus arachidicola]
MKEVYQCFRDDDLDVVNLYADALVYIAPRKMFHVQSGLLIAGSPVREVRAVFDLGLQHPNADKHAGLIHFWIHYLEMSATPAVALPAADRLRHLVSDAAHIHHMPHTSTREISRQKWRKELLQLLSPAQLPLPSLHNYTSKPDEIKNLPLPHDQDLYCVTTTITHYGKGIAWAATGNVLEADKERELYHAAEKRVPSTRKDFPNQISDVLKVATAMLDGEVEYRRGNYGRAFKSLCEAIRHEDSLMYTEPWG